jgi:hypothetical protein
VVTIQLNLAGVSQVSIEAEHEAEWWTDSATIALLGPYLRTIEHELQLVVKDFLKRKPPLNGKAGSPCQS